MNDLDPKTAKKIWKAMRKFGFDAFYLFAIRWDPKDKTQFFRTVGNRINSQEDLQALGCCIKQAMEASPALIFFVQAVIDQLTTEIHPSPSKDPLFPS